MGVLFVIMGLTFFALLIINLVFIGINIYFLVTEGLQALLQGMNFIERIYFSIYVKWIILADVLWIIAASVFAFKRKHYRTDPKLDYLQNNPINNPRICVVVVAYNEELAIGRVVKDFFSQPHVEQVIVVDNHSADKTVEVAKKCGAKVITKEKNMGFAHSCVMGLKESLMTGSNLIVLVEGDGSANGYDLSKMVPYLNHCDMVVGTRLVQVLSEKGNQVKMMYVWGNYFLAKLIQIKFFSLLHMGVVELTDVGCILRMIRKEALEKIIDKFTDPKTGRVIPGNEFALFMAIEALKQNLRIIEVPVTSNKRIGISKIGSDKRMKAIKMGLGHIWYILRS